MQIIANKKENIFGPEVKNCLSNGKLKGKTCPTTFCAIEDKIEELVNE